MSMSVSADVERRSRSRPLNAHANVRERLHGLDLADVLQFVDMFYLVHHALPRVHACMLALGLDQEAAEWQALSDLLVGAVRGRGGSRGSRGGVDAFLTRMCDVRDVRLALIGVVHGKQVQKRWKKIHRCMRQQFQADVDNDRMPVIPPGPLPSAKAVADMRLLGIVPMFPYL